jgi:probable F420-dependent oxidoreductase
LEVYAALDDPRMPLRDVPAYARRAERIGFRGLLIPEAVHDGLLTSLLALEHTERLRVVTSVLVAFPRSPTTVAYAAWDLQSLSGGRFGLGLGSQIKGNIVGRFGVEWSAPVPRMRDYIGAVRAVWRAWQSGEKLDFESSAYALNRMQPFFNPGPIEHPDIPILLGGVNRRMTRLAGECADGFMTHPTNTGPRYLREVINPELVRGAEGINRSVADVEKIASTFVATGRDTASVAREREQLREILGFVYSTPQYWPSLQLYGWEGVGERLLELTRVGRWGEMKQIITDEIFETLVPCGTYDEIAPRIREWYAGLVDAITLRMPANPDDDRALGRVIEQLRD